MRFTTNGPNIPDDLLYARDEDRVIFFCGAGVSRDKADLPDFLSLTHKVLEQLRVEKDSAIYQLLDADKQIYETTKHSLLSLDRIFGLLETDFTEKDIINEVAKALKPGKSINLEDHEILLRLSTTSYGKTRLVTTNFDRLFEACDPSLRVWSQPKLPDPKNNDDFQGIIHLHGVVNRSYDSCNGDGFVLSSSEFGHAYLAEGWATRFIKTVLGEYIVVFVGYKADDPPIRYILEAFNKHKKELKGIYAFHNVNEGNAQQSWGSKGVQAIEYLGHQTLWETLELWAERADDPRQWRLKVLEKAKSGPADLLPHERGQVAHIVSTDIGMQSFADMKELLPAEWLCVFDPSIRLSKPFEAYWWDEERKSETITPFQRYGLDCDTFTEDENSTDSKQEFPEGTWNAFALTQFDKAALSLNDNATVAGYGALHITSLVPRLWNLRRWIAGIAREPLTVWWSVKQGGLHPQIVELILRDLRDEETQLKDLWHTLADLWRNTEESFHRYTFEDRFKNRELASDLFLSLFAYYRPKIEVKLGYIAGRNPPLGQHDYRAADMVRFELEYRQILYPEIPDKLLQDYVRRFRFLIEEATEMEKHYLKYDANRIDPIHNVPDPHHEVYCDDGLSRYVRHFVNAMERLTEINPQKAKKECLTWLDLDNDVFLHLSVWISADTRLFDDKEAAQIILSLNNELFWDAHLQRDLLITLKNRWKTYLQHDRVAIENRLLRGRDKFKHENDQDFADHSSWQTLERLYWLKSKGCEFTFDLDQKTRGLRALHSDWDESKIQNADRSIQARGGIVRKNRGFDELLNIPLGDVLSKALEIRQRRDESLLEFDPYEGLVKNKPIRAFSALTHNARNNDYPRWAWNDFLSSTKRENDSLRFMIVIARRISQIPDNHQINIIQEVVRWFENIAKRLFEDDEQSFDILWNRLMQLLQTNAKAGKSAVTKLPDKLDDWTTYAINAPSGHLAMIAMKIAPDVAGKGCLFPKWWLIYVEQLLRLPERAHSYALAVLTRNLGWFDYYDPIWTQTYLMPFIASQVREDKEAFLSGLFRGGKVPRSELFLQIKPTLFELVEKKQNSHSTMQSLTAFLLIGWVPFEGVSVFSDNELRDCILKGGEEFRNQILITIRRWIYQRNNDWNLKTIDLLNNVWPRQKSIRTPKILGNICDVLLADSELFINSYLNVIELVRGMKIEHVAIRQLSKDENKIIELYPKESLHFLYAILSEDAKEWWYNTEDILSEILTQQPELKTDSCYINLQRRWDNRFR